MKNYFTKVISFMMFFFISLSIIASTVSVKADSDCSVYIEGQYVASVSPSGAVELAKTAIRVGGKLIDILSKIQFIKQAYDKVNEIVNEKPCDLYLVLNSAGLPDFPPGSRFGKIDVINSVDPKNIFLK